MGVEPVTCVAVQSNSHSVVQVRQRQHHVHHVARVQRHPAHTVKLHGQDRLLGVLGTGSAVTLWGAAQLVGQVALLLCGSRAVGGADGAVSIWGRGVSEAGGAVTLLKK